MSELKYDPEFWEVIKAVAGGPSVQFDDPVVLRNTSEKFLAQLLENVPRPAGIAETRYEVESLDGARISVTRFIPSTLQDAEKPQRAVVYVHGGGMIMGSVDLFKSDILNYAHASAIQIFAVDYRLAPENPAPAAVEDTFAVVQWLQSHAEDFNVDRARIGLFGLSAGGGVAAGTALLARDKGLVPPIARLVMVYPMLDDRTTIPSDNARSKYLTWTDHHNRLGWKAYLGGREWDQRDDVSIYASPGRAESLEGLPPTYVDVGGLDILLDDAVGFVGKLAKANNSVEFHLYPGVSHGWDGAAPMIRAAKEAMANRIRALTDF